MSYTYSNSTILNPHYIKQYVSDDGNFVVIPMAGKSVKYTTIIKGQPSGKLYRKFDTALKEVLKCKKQFDNKTYVS